MSKRSPVPYVFEGNPDSRLVTAALHAGHDVRPEVADLLALDDATRLREEDPYTDQLAACGGFRLLVNRSRYEVDLNRERRAAVYRTPEESWGLQVWRDEPSQDLIDRSLEIHDSFHAGVATHFDKLAAAGPFVVFSVHSYNHRRNGPGEDAAPEADNPDVNVGTVSLDVCWRPVVDAFIDVLSGTVVKGRPLDVRENVRFKGLGFPPWVHARYPTTGCVLALEFKKTFMDEWTGAVDREHLNALTSALSRTVPVMLQAMRRAA
jgi:N-formylglutamate amidohydrolase